MRSRHRGRVPGPMAELARETLHTSVTDPVSASMNFLNEVASRFPAAISLAAGRPFDEFYAVEDVERYLAAYIGYLRGSGPGRGARRAGHPAVRPDERPARGDDRADAGD